MRRWELWSSEDGHYFFPEDNEHARTFAIEEGMTLEWETTAKGWNAAQQALYVHRGWGRYNPSLRDDGTPYPDEEDDDHQPESD